MELEIKVCKDADLIAKLNAHVQEAHNHWYPHIFKPFNFEAIRNALSDMMAADNVQAFVAEANSDAIGYIVLVVKRSEENAFKFAEIEVYVDQIGVLPKARGRGIATALLNHAVAFSRTQGASRMALDHWIANNYASQFFSNFGFEIVCQHRYFTL